MFWITSKSNVENIPPYMKKVSRLQKCEFRKYSFFSSNISKHIQCKYGAFCIISIYSWSSQITHTEAVLAQTAVGVLCVCYNSVKILLLLCKYSLLLFWRPLLL